MPLGAATCNCGCLSCTGIRGAVGQPRFALCSSCAFPALRLRTVQPLLPVVLPRHTRATRNTRHPHSTHTHHTTPFPSPSPRPLPPLRHPRSPPSTRRPRVVHLSDPLFSPHPRTKLTLRLPQFSLDFLFPRPPACPSPPTPPSTRTLRKDQTKQIPTQIFLLRAFPHTQKHVEKQFVQAQTSVIREIHELGQ